ncbi:death-on-curing protein [Acidocella aquatica]|uniref:Death-on-curing protein n=1 Tax=Acidocella aquatica TaxID=1922313 RepID=A0ABQ6A5E0_9PROT|nr:type II toxin-antitoxin system death-on-curing family toxin [Acidocella aquatica]GLR66523.1 death-on-curing protein [Acidocella aquatica]
MSGPAFLEPDAVLFLHDQSIREYGGYHGLRDEALLSSALNRPVDKFGYDPAVDWTALGAAYAFGIAKNHAFLDGNKRTAWACCVLFLKINGIELQVLPQDAVEAVVSLATGGMNEGTFAVWLRLRTRS